MMNIMYVSIIAIFAARGCEDEVMLIPDDAKQTSGSLASGSVSNLLNGVWSSPWGGTSGSIVEYTWSSKVVVKEVFVQRYYRNAGIIEVWVGSTHFRSNFAYTSSLEQDYAMMTFPVNNIQADSVRLRVYRAQYNSYAYISIFEVYGCYNTSTPTVVPTSGPTELPTVFPSPSPTQPPITTHPTNTPSIIPTTIPTGLPSTFPTTAPTALPSIFPTTAPTLSPTAERPSTHPSSVPTWSPTEPPSPTPSFSPSFKPTVVYVDRGFHFTVGQIEFLLIIVVILCAALFFGYRRYKKVLKAKDHLQKIQVSEMQIVHSRDIEEANTRIVTQKEFNRNGNMDQAIHNEGENSNTNICKSSNLRVGEEKNGSIGCQMPGNQTTDFRFGLDKVNSEL